MPDAVFILSLDEHQLLSELGEDHDPEEFVSEVMRRAGTTPWRRAKASETGPLHDQEAQLTTPESVVEMMNAQLEETFGDQPPTIVAALSKRLEELMATAGTLVSA